MSPNMTTELIPLVDPLCSEFTDGKCLKCKEGRVCKLDCEIFSYEGCVQSCDSSNQVLLKDELGNPFCKQCGDGCTECSMNKNKLTC